MHSIPLGIRRSRFRFCLCILLLFCLSVLLSGCGGQFFTPSPTPQLNTGVLVLMSSSARGHLWSFGIRVTAIRLQDSSGKSISLYPGAQAAGSSGMGVEFIHLNGNPQPVAWVGVPRGTYTSATITTTECGFSTAGEISSGGLGSTTDIEKICSQGTGTTTVNLPSPIMIGSDSLMLDFDLQTSQSYQIATGLNSQQQYTISPVFTLTALPIASLPTNRSNGLLYGLDGKILDSPSGKTSFTIQTLEGESITLNDGASTIYQGVSGQADLKNGMFVDMDTTVGPDGTPWTTWIAAANPPELYWMSGPVGIGTYLPTGQFTLLPAVELGMPSMPAGGMAIRVTDKTVFQIDGHYSNLNSLPFQADFSAATLFPGQNIGVFFSSDLAAAYPAVDSITLLPQTISGSVTSLTSTGGFTIAQIQLAPTDLIASLQAVTGPVQIANPTGLSVYMDGNTDLSAAGTLASGEARRFRGLLFDDNGVLRMDCDAVLPPASGPSTGS